MILLTYGTRPEFIKIKSLINVFNNANYSYKVLYTGQQKDLAKFECDYAFTIEDGINRLDAIIKSILDQLHIIQDEIKIDYILVQGDTTSALAMALSAFHHNIKIIHLEAGLRTYDNKNPYPEEQNRKLISQLTNIHLCPTELSKNNLLNEKVNGDIYVVGNTVIDNLVQYKNSCEYSNKILITLHRRENHNIMDKWFIEINKLAKKYTEYEFILPIHPNPNVQKFKYILENVNVIAPLPYDELIQLLIKTRLVITDSGGIQEECSFFNKKCLTCRIVTERPEAINQSTFLIKTPEKLIDSFETHHRNFEINYICPFGNGNSAEKIYEILKIIL